MCVYVLSHLSRLSHFAHYFCYSAALVFVFAMAFSARSLSLLFRSIAVQMKSQRDRQTEREIQRERDCDSIFNIYSLHLFIAAGCLL